MKKTTADALIEAIKYVENIQEIQGHIAMWQGQHQDDVDAQTYGLLLALADRCGRICDDEVMEAKIAALDKQT